jgi:hypothetical protein
LLPNEDGDRSRQVGTRRHLIAKQDEDTANVVPVDGCLGVVGSKPRGSPTPREPPEARNHGTIQSERTLRSRHNIGLIAQEPTVVLPVTQCRVRLVEAGSLW